MEALRLETAAEVGLGRWPRRARVVPAALLSATAAAVISLAGADQPDICDTLWRALIGFPASLLAATGLVMAGRASLGTDNARWLRRWILGAAASFAAYGFLAGLVGPRTPLAHAPLINVETFRALTGLPVELFRAACAAAVAGFLAEAFVVETARHERELQRLRTESLSAVAHDLRNPVAAIRLAADALEGELRGDPDAERERPLLGTIRSGTRSLDRMVNDLLDASRIEARRLELRKARIDLPRLLHEVVGRSGAVLAGRPVRLSVPDTLPPADADPVRIEQVLVNLLSNAAKYSDPGTEILLTAEPKDGEVLVSVTNSGAGIPPEEIPRLFVPFHRAKTTEGRVPGVGLGLFIAKGLVEAHGGRMWVESEVGRTTTFRFALPL